MPPAKPNREEELPALLSVTEMSAAFGVSRRRWYELIAAGKVPPPVLDISTRRPNYPRELQEVCYRVRATGIAFDGRPILFNRRRTGRDATPTTRTAARPRSLRATPDRHVKWIEHLAALNVHADAEAVDAALSACFPSGVGGVDDGVVVKRLHRYLRKNRSK
jgi:hypothetical protein